MGDLSPLTFSIVTLLLLGFLLWFALGTQRNVSRGNDFLRWLQSGLPLLGSRTTLRWLGSSAVELKLVEPGRPFSEAQVVVVLEPRDITWLWALARARGRRDFLIVRARLQRSPRFELEAGDKRGWTGEDRIRGLDPSSWQSADWGSETIRVAHTREADSAAVRRIWQSFEAQSAGVWRLSVRRDAPHIEVHVRLPRTPDTDAQPLFATFRELAEQVMRPP